MGTRKVGCRMIPVSLREKRKAGLTSSPRRADSYAKYVFSRTQVHRALGRIGFDKSWTKERRNEAFWQPEKKKKIRWIYRFPSFFLFSIFASFVSYVHRGKKLYRMNANLCVTGEKLANRWITKFQPVSFPPVARRVSWQLWFFDDNVEENRKVCRSNRSTAKEVSSPRSFLTILLPIFFGSSCLVSGNDWLVIDSTDFTYRIPEFSESEFYSRGNNVAGWFEPVKLQMDNFQLYKLIDIWYFFLEKKIYSLLEFYARINCKIMSNRSTELFSEQWDENIP